MLVAVQKLAGRDRSCFMSLNHFGAAIAGRRDFVVAVLSSPEASEQGAKLRAEQIAHSFAYYHGEQIRAEAAAEEAESERRLSTYTVHDVLRPAGGDGAGSSAPPEPGTAAKFAEFKDLYLRKVLQAPKYRRLWLSAISAVPGV
eukprot:CAMPEP_0177593082 /NCGR_PEP_ID=MMETSP0419_2-20121207/8929_1 /TAXON_ID=582737 /ORGANISM="Tetraselmis sp., Strain GSL018" /LENGTH=143 /DNA_ID=CAMNT_0019084043 /DNA_START=671 /DNA_END=1098 /DNA_ORIENTATION=+